MTDWLLNESFVRGFIAWLAVATPIGALLLFGARIGRRAQENGVGAAGPPRRLKKSRAGLVLLGISGPLIWALWHVYEAIMDALGFSSVAGLLLTLVLFGVVGIAVGWIAGRVLIERRGP